jgi:ATP-dependent Lon protease
MDELDQKVYQCFAGRVVKKGATKLVKGFSNVPTYVLEYLLGTYCTSDSEADISQGVEQTKEILTKNYVRNDEVELIKTKIRDSQTYNVIDVVDARFDEKKNIYYAHLHNMGIINTIPDETVKKNERLLSDGIWCIVQLSYQFDEDQGGAFVIDEITPIQMPDFNLDEIVQARKNFTKEEWIDLILRSTGMEPSYFKEREKWHMMARLLPMIESNMNICELGPRSTGKSFVYKEISPNSILLSGGQTTVANLFYNMAKHTVGLVGMWDVVAFDEVAGINFKDHDGVQIMKDYMNSGSFVRGKETVIGKASFVFEGNINESVDSLLKTSTLFQPFPEHMIDTAFLDRMHLYIPGWEVPKLRPEFFTDNWGFISDYFAEFLREMRKTSDADCYRKWFKLGRCLNQRDVMAVNHVVSGFCKLLYPDGKYSKQDVEEILRYALEGRRRVKEQLKKLGGMEFYDVQFSYIDLETMDEKFVSVQEQGGGKLIPEGQGKPGTLFTTGASSSMIGLVRIECSINEKGSGKFDTTGLGSSKELKEAMKTAQSYFKANAKQISQTISLENKDYLMNVEDLQGVGVDSSVALAAYVSYCSAALARPVSAQLVLLGSITIGGTINKVTDLANTLQVCFDSGAKKVLLPMSSAPDIGAVPAELFAKFQTSFYTSPEDAVIKALGIE